jgi:hypothetical protein
MSSNSESSFNSGNSVFSRSSGNSAFSGSSGSSGSSAFSGNSRNFENAGIIFLQGNSVLAGLQRKWIKREKNWEEQRFISGFGGRKNPGETSIRTAIRETLEELYEFIKIEHLGFNPENYESKKVYSIKRSTKIPRELLNEIEKNIDFSKQFINNGYHLYQLNYADLIKILNMVKNYLNKNKPLIASIAYPTELPKDINELVTFPRADLHGNLEILQIYNLFIDDEQLRNRRLTNIRRGTTFDINNSFSSNINMIKRSSR